MKYKVRCSRLSELLAGCRKKKNEFIWEDLNVFNDTHIKLAVEIYNEQLFKPAEITTIDMQAGKELEKDAVLLYDSVFETDYIKDYERSRSLNLPYEKENDFIRGSRDFGSNTKTIDCKISTDKNVFDTKRFLPPENEYVIQLNGYAWLYGSTELELFNALMMPTQEQIRKMASNKAYIENLDESEFSVYQSILERSYGYDMYLSDKQRVHIKQIPLIPNFQGIIKIRVKLLNEWIEKNLE